MENTHNNFFNDSWINYLQYVSDSVNKETYLAGKIVGVTMEHRNYKLEFGHQVWVFFL